MANNAEESYKKIPLTSSKSLPPSPPIPRTSKTSSPSDRPSLRSATSLTLMPPTKTWPSSVLLETSMLVVALMLLLLPVGLALPTATNSLRFVTQSADRPLALYRAPTPYHQFGKHSLNSVIITSKPLGISEAMGTTLPPATPESSTESSSTPFLTATSGGAGATASASAPPWRRADHSPTTDKPAITIAIPQYSIDCREGQSCSETIAVDAAKPEPAFKRYPQEELDKLLREIANTRVATDAQLDDDGRRKEVEDNANRMTNRLANLYLENEDEKTEEQETSEDEKIDSAESEGKSRWHLLSSQQHHHPYDDRDGWVSLEPVPWSTSKVSKWHATLKRPEYNKPPNRWDTRPPLDWVKPTRPQWVRPSYEEDYDRPSGLYGSRPPLNGDRWQDDPKPPSHWDKPTNDYDYHHKPWASNQQDIITDNRPNRWPEHHSLSSSSSGGHGAGYRPSHEQKPHYDYSHGHGLGHGHGHGHGKPGFVDGAGQYDSHRHPPSHPDESEGEWVLISSTKGYATPHRHKIFQRALAISGKPLTSRRTVRLTVLPALNGSANTTISHGGLLEVESTFHSVEEEHRQQQEQLQLQRPGLQHDPARPYVPVATLRPHPQHYVPVDTTQPPYDTHHNTLHGDAQRPHLQHDYSPGDTSQAQFDYQRPTLLQSGSPGLVQAVRPKSRNIRVVPAPQDNSRAVLAAVGAGMVPATIALMAPLVLGRRRRRSLLQTLRTPPEDSVQDLIEAFKRSTLREVKK